MKTLLISIALLATSIAGNAQTADQIIQESIDAIGGKLWDKVNGLQYKATIEQGGMQIPLDVVYLRDGKTYTKYSIQGMELTENAFDGKVLWSTNFMNQKPEKADSEATENFERTVGEFPNALMTYKKLGFTATLEGAEKVDGTDCHKIKLVKKNKIVEGAEVANIEYYFIDKESKALLLVESELMSGEMKGKISQVKFSDYQEIDGMYFAFSQSMGIKDGMSQSFSFTEIKINPTIDAAAFKYTGE
jgi:outer membrane lipoprotein-sorting protein